MGTLTVAIVLMSVAQGARADNFKWTDDEGGVHYGDSPPAGTRAERINISPGRDDGEIDEGEARRRRLLEQADDRAAERIEQQRELREAEQRKREMQAAERESCLDARKQLDVLQEQKPVYRDENGNFRVRWREDAYQGEREYLDDAMRSAEIARVQEKIAKHCRYPDDARDQALARVLQIRAERCEAARAELELLEQLRTRTPRQEIERQRARVRRLCEP